MNGTRKFFGKGQPDFIWKDIMQKAEEIVFWKGNTYTLAQLSEVHISEIILIDENKSFVHFLRENNLGRDTIAGQDDWSHPKHKLRVLRCVDIFPLRHKRYFDLHTQRDMLRGIIKELKIYGITADIQSRTTLL